MEQRLKIKLNLPIQFAEQREKSRVQLNGLLPGKIRNATTGNYVSCRPIDISESGLGILSSDQIKVGEVLILEIKDKEHCLRVEWEKKDFSKKDLVRFGLKVEDKTTDLIKIFKDKHCLA